MCQGAVAAAPQCGEASWYDHGAGAKTADGGAVDPNAMTAAHRTVPFGNKLRVVNTSNGKEVEVEVNDRGPFVEGRIIDVSRAAAEELGFKSKGVAQVHVSLPGDTAKKNCH
jgi:rare lipoprotein A